MQLTDAYFFGIVFACVIFVIPNLIIYDEYGHVPMEIVVAELILMNLCGIIMACIFYQVGFI